MAENKTKATDASVEAYFAAIADEQRRADCRALATVIGKVSKQKPQMWGTGIVGFGSYHYRYESGREGDSCVVGFAARKSDISVYLMGEFAGRDDLLARLGRHKMAKACLSLRTLSDVDMTVLEKLVAGSIAALSKRYGYVAPARESGRTVPLSAG